MPQLDVATYLSQLFWLAILFGLLYLVVSRVAVPRIGEALEQRHRRIADDLETAERLNRQAQELLQLREEALARARAEAQQAVRDAKARAQAELEARRQELEADLARRLAEAERRLRQARQQALRELEGSVGELGAEIVGKVAGVKVAAREVEKVLARIGGADEAKS